nr:MAG TPA: hypothetical protein [Caudoviricetes sp.]
MDMFEMGPEAVSLQEASFISLNELRSALWRISLLIKRLNGIRGGIGWTSRVSSVVDFEQGFQIRIFASSIGKRSYDIPFGHEVLFKIYEDVPEKDVYEILRVILQILKKSDFEEPMYEEYLRQKNKDLKWKKEWGDKTDEL